MKVLGIDVGLRACGYVLCEVRGLSISLINEGQIQPQPARPLNEKLYQIFETLRRQIQIYAPTALVVEKLYSHYRHPTTLGVLAHVRGVVALLAYQEGLDFFEYSPTRARKAFLGKGRGDSAQVKKMAENVTGRQFKSLHTADAYSLVVAFSHTQKFKQLMRQLPKNTERKAQQKGKADVISNSRDTEEKRRTSSYR